MRNIFIVLAAYLFAALPCFASDNHLHVRTGHRSPISSVAFSPDGKTLASSSGDGTIRLWDVSAGSEIRCINATEFGPALSLSWHPDGQSITCGTIEQDIQIWAMQYSSKVQKLFKNGSPVMYPLFSPDGKMLAACGFRAPTLLSAKSGEVISKLLNCVPEKSADIDENSPTCAVWSADGKYLIEGTQSSIVKVWPIGISEKPFFFDCKFGKIYSVAISPDSQVAVAGTTFGDIVAWNLRTKKLMQRVRAHTGRLYGLSFSPDGKTIASGGVDKMVKIWDWPSCTLRQQIALKSGLLRALQYSPDGQSLAICDNCEVRLLDSNTGVEVRKFGERAKNCMHISVSPDGGRLLAASSDHTIKLISLVDGLPIEEIATKEESNDSADFTKYGGLVVAHGRTFNWQRIVSSQSTQLFSINDGKPSSVGIYSEINKTGGGSKSQSDISQNANPGGEVLPLNGSPPSIAPQLSPDGSKIVISAQRLLVRNLHFRSSDGILHNYASRDGWASHLKVLDAKSHKTIALFSDSAICHWMDDSKRLSVYDGAGFLSVYAVSPWKRLKSKRITVADKIVSRQFNSNSLQTGSAIWSGDGKLIATQSGGTISVYNTDTLTLVSTFKIAPGRPDGLPIGGLKCFSPDNKNLLVSSVSYLRNETQLWDLSQKRACLRLDESFDRWGSATFSPDGRIIITTAGGQEIVFLDSHNGNELARLFMFGRSDWVVISPAGRFDASIGGMKMVYSDNNRETDLSGVILSQLRDTQLVPSLLKKMNVRSSTFP